MRRSTDRLIALQFLAVTVPIAFVLLAQMVADARRATALEHSRPLRTLANEARANYRTFTNGAADAVDTGALGRQFSLVLSGIAKGRGAGLFVRDGSITPVKKGSRRSAKFQHHARRFAA